MKISMIATLTPTAQLCGTSTGRGSLRTCLESGRAPASTDVLHVDLSLDLSPNSLTMGVVNVKGALPQG